MIVKKIPSSWLKNEGNRLDCGPFVSGSVEARYKLKALSGKTAALSKLTLTGGILNGPVFKRHYVNDEAYGIPFLGSSDMVNSRFEKLPLFSTVEANKTKLKPLILKEGSSLISCSGTIGKMAYVTSEMAGFLSSQHLIKVIPDETKVNWGYLYAFLSSVYANS
ncbi:restriction endonuclease subunit S, partial [Vibrio parahaemolyticus]